MAQLKLRLDRMFDATNEDAVTAADQSARLRPMDIVQGQLQFWHKEDIEHVPRLTQRHIELAHNAREFEDHAQGLRVLSLPASVEAALHAEVADDMSVSHRSNGFAFNLD